MREKCDGEAAASGVGVDGAEMLRWNRWHNLQQRHSQSGFGDVHLRRWETTRNCGSDGTVFVERKQKEEDGCVKKKPNYFAILSADWNFGDETAGVMENRPIRNCFSIVNVGGNLGCELWTRVQLKIA